MFQNYIPLNKLKTIKYSNDEIKIKTKNIQLALFK